MEILLNKLSDTEAVIKVSIKEEDYQSAFDKKVKEYSKKANIKGFRAGKVPPGIIKKMYGNSIKLEEINQQVYQELNGYIKDNDLDILGYPLPDAEKAASIDWENQKDFEFDYSIGMPGNFDVSLSKSLKLNAYKVEVGEKDVQQSIENIQKKYGEYSHPETSEEGHLIYGEITDQAGEISLMKSIEINDKLKSSFKKKVIGLNKESSFEFKATDVSSDEQVVSMLLDKPYDEIKKEKLALTFKVQDVTAIKPAELNEELFTKVFGEAVKTEEELKDKIKEDLARDYDHHADLFFKASLKNELVKKTKIDLPDNFIKRWLLEAEQGKKTAEEIETDFPKYGEDLKWTLIQEKLIKDNDLKVESQEVKDEAQKLIEQQFKAYNIPLDPEQVQGMVDNYLQDQEGKNAQNIYGNLMTDKIVALVKENASVKEKTIAPEDFVNLKLN